MSSGRTQPISSGIFRQDWICKAGLSLLLVLCSLAVYWPVRNHEFVNYDDPDYVTSNSRVQAGLSAEGIKWAFTELHGERTYWHPLTWLSHMLDIHLFGMNSGAHHLVSVGFHSLNAVLLFLFLAAATGLRGRSFVVAALFALHPLQVDTVAWLAERKNILAGLFWILTLYAYVWYARAPKPLKLFLPLSLFILGLMCKPVLVTLPCVLLLLDFWPLGRFPSMQNGIGSILRSSTVQKLALEKLPFFVLSLASGLLTIQSHNALGMTNGLNGSPLPLQLRVENALVSYSRYIGKALFPHDLCVLYLHPGEWPVPTVLASLVVIGLLTFICLKLGKKSAYLPFGWLWFLGVLVPFIGLRQVGIQAMADRFSYVPIIGIFIMAVWGIADLQSKWAGKKAWLLPAIATCLLLTCALVSSRQLAHWQNSGTLFEQALRVDPNNYVASHHLAVTLTTQEKFAEALAIEDRVLKSYPNYMEAAVQKSLIRMLEKQSGSLASKGGGGGNVISNSEQPSEVNSSPDAETSAAINNYLSVVKKSPENADAYYQLALLYGSRHQTSASIAAYKSVLAVRPKSPDALNNLAWLLATCAEDNLRNGAEAVQLAESACELTRWQTPVMIGTLAAAYAEAGRYEEAVRTAEKACQLAGITKDEKLVAANQKLLDLYRSGRPYREVN